MLMKVLVPATIRRVLKNLSVRVPQSGLSSWKNIPKQSLLVSYNYNRTQKYFNSLEYHKIQPNGPEVILQQYKLLIWDFLHAHVIFKKYVYMLKN